MVLGVLSDTHDQIEMTRRAVAILQNAGAHVLVHCGDISGPMIVAACSVLPCYFVLGNWDADNVPALRKAADDNGAVCLGWGDTVILAAKRIGIVHGHMRIDVRRVMASKPHYLLSGHSHIPSDQYEGGTRRINPGALHDADQFTVALLDLDRDVLRFLTVPVSE